MSNRIGIVVATHPEDHSVDLVMADNGQRLVGVQVLSSHASARSGLIDLPAVPQRDDPWDVTKTTGQDMKAVVSFVGHFPIVVGFLFPQVNQVLPADPKTRINRHQSDVMTMIDGDGNIQLTHPSGTYIRIGETPGKVDMASKNADANAAFDRNTGRLVNVRIGLANGVLDLTLKPNGDVELNSDGRVDIAADGAIHIQSGTSITLQAPRIDLN